MVDDTDFDTHNKCKTARDEKGLDNGEYSTCYEKWYESMPTRFDFDYYEIEGLVNVGTCEAWHKGAICLEGFPGFLQVTEPTTSVHFTKHGSD